MSKPLIVELRAPGVAKVQEQLVWLGRVEAEGTSQEL
jgi:hypothetical protein